MLPYRVAYVSAAPFQLLLSPIYCRKVIPNPAPMFHALPCASCVLRPALRPTMRFVPCVRLCALFPVLVSTLPSISCAAPCPSPPLCHLLHRATLLRYNFGLSCRTVIPSAAPRLFRRYSLEYNRTKVPSAVKPENTNRCSILCKRLKMAILHFCCRFRYCFFEQSIRKILTFALFGYKIKS